jgi:ATP-dependent exoDNAse (exonuclease V) beta subunit
MHKRQKSLSEGLAPLLAGARPEQREAVTAPEPLVVVSAGAGTGKTFTLAARFAWLLASDPSCRIEEILTLTFTDKAAGEMRERIRTTLRNLYEGAPEALPHLRDALARLDDAYIATIHAFASRVLREAALNLDLDPRATLAAPPWEEQFWEDAEEALEQLDLEWFASRLAPPWRERARTFFAQEDVLSLAGGFSAADLATLARTCASVIGGAGKTPETLWNWDEEADRAAAAPLLPALRQRWNQAWELWHERLFPELETVLSREKSAFAGALGEFWKAWKHERADATETESAAPGAARFLGALLEGPLAKLPPKSDAKSRIEEMLGRPLKEWRDEAREDWQVAAILLATPFLGEPERSFRTLLFRLASLVWQTWNETRASAGVLTFDDLIRFAGEALAPDGRDGAEATSPGTRLRFRHILVDEFQDTDPLQDRLLRRLWRPGENTLFLVGDLKQSIYRFRHADLRLFAAYIRAARSGTCASLLEDGAPKAASAARYVSLATSFRSAPGVLEAVNTLFGFLWRKGLSGASEVPLPYEPLRSPEGENGASPSGSPDNPETTEKEGTGPLRPLGETFPGKANAAVPRGDDAPSPDTRLRNDGTPPPLTLLVAVRGKGSGENGAPSGPSGKGRGNDAGSGSTHSGETESGATAPGDALPGGDDGEEEKLASARSRLAEELAALLLAWRREGCAVREREGTTVVHRLLRWGDVAVLTPARSFYGVLEQAFERADIPARFEKNRSFFTRGEVSDLTNGLGALADPEDDLLLAGWLASPFSLVPSEEAQRMLDEAATLRHCGTRGEKAAPGRGMLHSLLAERHPLGAERFETLRRRALCEGPAAALASLTEDLRWLRSYPAATRSRVAANLQRTVELAREYESTFGPSLAGCAAYLGRALRRERDVEESGGDEGADQVRILTVHAAKGLEFPVTVLFGLERTPLTGHREGALRTSRALGVVATRTPDGESDPAILPAKRLAKALEEQEEREEQARLFYVAATRARDALVLCGVAKRKERDGEANLFPPEHSWLAWTRDALGDLERHPAVRLLEVEDALPETGALSGSAPEAGAPGVAGAGAAPEPEGRCVVVHLSPREEMPRSLERLSATSFALWEYCPRAWRRQYRQGRDLEWERFREGGESEGGADLGSLAHELLKRWNFLPDSLDRLLPVSPDAARQLLAKRLPPALRGVLRNRSALTHLRGWLSAFATTEEGRRLAGLAAEKSVPLFREWPFHISLETLVLEGAIDLFWIDGEGLHLRDYKTGPRRSAPETLHEDQLRFYAVAVLRRIEEGRSSFGETPRTIPQALPLPADLRILYLRPPLQSVSVTFPETTQGLRELEQRILRAGKNAANGPWPRGHGCARCPWRQTCGDAS